MSHSGGRRKKHGGEHENNERWLLTYADMITLLVAFFIMLYAMSVTNTAKFVKLAISVRSGFGNGTTKTCILDSNGADGTKMSFVPYQKPSRPKSLLPQDRMLGVGLGDASRRSSSPPTVESKLQDIVKQASLSKHISVIDEERGVVVSVLADKSTFDSGSADLKPAMRPILNQIANVMESVPNEVRIEGHTDDLPISTDRFPSNWQLSAARASNVLCYFVSNKYIDPDRISCVGYGATRPLQLNSSEHNRSLNRRVDIVILRDSPA